MFKKEYFLHPIIGRFFSLLMTCDEIIIEKFAMMRKIFFDVPFLQKLTYLVMRHQLECL